MIRTVTLRQQIPAQARTPCAEPVVLPDRDLTQSEVTASWGKDRSALRACEQRRAAAVRSVTSGDQ